MKYGVILARFQPIHNGHIALIKKAVEENDEVLILIGSADKINARNPIPANLRKQFVEEALEEHGLIYKCKIALLDDLTDESDNSITWGFYLFAKISTILQQNFFTMYYSDGFEIITSWFPGYILKNHVSLSLLARGAVEKGVSATEVRKSIFEDSGKFETLVPKVVINYKEIIKSFILIHNK